MSVTWARQLGDPSELALKLELATDPDQGRGADPDVAASWGTFSLWAGGVNVTAFSDGQETHASVNWYLLPLLEWLADRWDPLFHEERLPCRVAGDDAAASLARTAFPPHAAQETWERDWQAWWHRHALQSARQGGPFPDVMIRRWRDQLEVSWRSLAPAGVPEDVRFLAADGHARCDAAEAARVIYDVSAAAVAQLRHMRPKSSRLVDLERRFKAIRSSEAAPRLSWLSGLGDRYSGIMASVRKDASSVIDLFAPNTTGDLIVSGSCHGTLLFGSMSPSVAAADVLVIAHHMAGARADHADGAYVETLARPVSLASRYDIGPQGDELAAELREDLSLPEDAVPEDLDALLARLDVAVEDVDLTDGRLRGVALAGPDLAPTILVNERSHSRSRFSLTSGRRRRRFTLAHELCHLLFDRGRGAPLAIASGPWAPADVERRANAFAAGLLMPEEAVAAAVAANDLYTLAGVGAVAEALDASISATIARLHVLGHIDDETEDDLKDQLAPR